VIHSISTGCKTIDTFLGGGIPSGNVSLVYGEPETGKTTFAIQCSVNCALQGFKTLFVDCDGSFAVQRLAQVASDNFEKIADHIILMKPKDFHEQAEVTERLAEYAGKGFGLVVFDTITSLYRLKVAQSPSKTFELNRDLNRQLATLAQLARTQKIAVLLDSQVRTDFSGVTVGIEPVGTRVVKFWADTVIELKPTENPQLIKAVVEKNPRKTPSITCNLKIDETGIHDYLVR
jgi:RecA/RadA recombinase